MDSSKADAAGKAEFARFAGYFKGNERRGLNLFYDCIANRQVIPYKIKNKTFSILVADTAALTLELKFRGVVIEDGHHPLEILMTDVRGERMEDGAGNVRYRIRFVNGLRAQGRARESSFSFEDLESALSLWNYDFTTYAFAAGEHKMPWRLVYEPAAAFMEKWRMLGEPAMNTYELGYATIIQFLYTYLGLYLDGQTGIGYGRSSISYDRALIEANPLTKRMQLAARKLFEMCGWQDMIDALRDYDSHPRQFFELWVYRITDKAGSVLYDCANEIIDRCAHSYPQRGDLAPAFGGQREIVRDTLDHLFLRRGYQGHYPDYVIQDSPRFIETNLVYERKYTFINAGRKLRLYSFIESVVDGGLQICAAKGSVYVKDIKEPAEDCIPDNALQCFFVDGGRRSAGITEGIYINPEMPADGLREDVETFFKRITEA